MRINKQFDVEFKNGYYIVTEYTVTGKNSNTPGKECVKEIQTYPTLLSAWEQSHIDQKDKSKFLDCSATVRGERDKIENIAFLKAKEVRLKAKGEEK